MKLNLIAGRLERATVGSAGYDIFANVAITIHPREHRLISTGVVASFDPGHVALFCDKSGHALKRGLTVLGGVIDSDYPGEWGVILYNTSTDLAFIRIGEAIANVLFLMLAQVECSDPGFANNSVVRIGGFGSTGG